MSARLQHVRHGFGCVRSYLHGPTEFPRNETYVYVPDVDTVYARALESGATSIAPPTDKPYRERQCGFIDAGENTWWVATFAWPNALQPPAVHSATRCRSQTGTQHKWHSGIDA